MYARWSTAIAVLRKGAARGLSLRQTTALSAFAAAHLSLYSMVNILRLLDYALAPQFKSEPLRGPVFIIATPRSGTTFLHHLLALDENNFSHLKLYQTVLPSVTADHLVQQGRRIDQLLGKRGEKLLAHLTQSLFSQWNGIHDVGLNREEEDEALFLLSLMSPALYLLFPYVADLPEFSDIDRELEPKALARLVRDYRLSVRRHLHVHGLSHDKKSRLPLIKNVLLPSRLHTVKKAFPDARFIRIKRDPLKAIPSAISLFYATWRLHSPEIAADSKEVSDLGKMFVKHYQKLDQFTEENPDSLTLSFESLIEDPLREVKKVYSHLHLELSSEAEEKMRQSIAQPLQHKSRHQYNLSSFGLSEEDIYRELPKERPQSSEQQTLERA